MSQTSPALFAVTGPANRGRNLSPRLALLAAVLLLTASWIVPADGEAPVAAPSATVQPPIEQRFAAATDEVPDFQKHVVPLLGQLGCNGRACHGSFQGQGGFQLSLFGYDFDMDHKGLSERLDVRDPAGSYVLQKATNTEEHEGGERIKPNSWQHRVFLNWLKGGAIGTKEPVKLERLEIQPAELWFDRSGSTVPLKVAAVWADGVREDVTSLCRFSSNDPQVATVSVDGVVTSVDPGDSHVVVFYDSAVVPVPVLQPVSKQYGDNYPAVAAATRIDELVIAKLRKLGVVPADLCTDEEYLRRVSLDLTGTLPTASEVESFCADPSLSKRADKVEELLDRPAYAAWWATRLCDFTGNNAAVVNNTSPLLAEQSQLWYDWIEARVRDNVPYDQIVSGIVLATSRDEGESYTDFCKDFCTTYQAGEQSLAKIDNMPYYWGRINFRTPEDRAIGFAYTFLGIRIQCAQCHKHPFDQWTQKDFKGFENFFTRTVFAYPRGGDPEYTALLDALKIDSSLKGNQQRQVLTQKLKDGQIVPLPELYTMPAKTTPTKKEKSKDSDKANKKGDASVLTAKLLGGDSIPVGELEDPRTPLMEWMASPDNRWFARAFVNRVWANYFHRGIVEPTDDLSLANPPSNAPLLDELASGFIAHKFDMQWLHREIIASDTYQRSWRTNATNELDHRNFSHAVPRRLPAEVAIDAVLFATASTERVSELQTSLKGRAIAVASGTTRNNNGANFALQVFGQSRRESNCDCDRSSEPSLLQTVYLQNDTDVMKMLSTRGGWVDEIADRFDINAGERRNEDSKPTGDSLEELQELETKVEQRLEKAVAKKEKNKIATYRKQLETIRERLKMLQQAANKTSAPQAPAAPALPEAQRADLIREAYLKTLSRLPTAEEARIADEYLATARTPVDGARDLLWTLINTKEFIVNH